MMQVSFSKEQNKHTDLCGVLFSCECVWSCGFTIRLWISVKLIQTHTRAHTQTKAQTQMCQRLYTERHTNTHPELTELHVVPVFHPR